MRKILWYFALPLRLIRRFATLLGLLALIASLALNLSMLTVSGVYAAASATLSGIGVSTAAAREASERHAQRKATRQIGRETAERVTARLQRGAARNIASVGGEAIPFVGVAVIAGALALDIADACETATDMIGLEAALAAEGDPEAARQRAIEDFECMAMIREQVPDYNGLPSKEDIWSMVSAAPGQAYQQAQNAGIAVRDLDWTGRTAQTLDMLMGWGRYLGKWFVDEDQESAQ